MRVGMKIKRCPLCGGKIIVSALYQISHDYTVTKNGKLSKKYTKGGIGSLDASIAACENARYDKCSAIWGCDEFEIADDDCFVDFKYTDI